MADEAVVDASVLAAIFFQEKDAPQAAQALDIDATLIAPALLSLEMASIAAKKVWRGEAEPHVGDQAVRQTIALTERPVPDIDLASRALNLAITHRFSAYDATYLALAEARYTRVLTLDAKLVSRAQIAGLGDLVELVA